MQSHQRNTCCCVYHCAVSAAKEGKDAKEVLTVCAAGPIQSQRKMWRRLGTMTLNEEARAKAKLPPHSHVEFKEVNS